jgi:quercetin dioxygenase-like cupin family protein
MKRSHIRRRTSGVLAAILLVGPSAIGLAQQEPVVPLVDASRLRLQPEQAIDGGRIFGDPSKPGIYIVRVRFNAGRGTRPHYHTQDRWATVIKGTWWTAEGDVYEPDKMIPIKEGGLMYHPAGLPHYDEARDVDVIVQIVGNRPVKTVPLEEKK